MSKMKSVVCTIAFVVLSARSSAFAEEQVSDDYGRQTAELVAGYLEPILKNARAAARIYYSSEPLAHNSLFGCPFPKMKILPPEKGLSGLAAVRSIFRDAKQVAAKTSGRGNFVITIGNPRKTILDTWIPYLAFSDEERFNRISAIDAIDLSQTIKLARQRLDIMETRLMTIGNVVMPNEDLPRLPKVIENVSFDEALDLVAATWGVTVSYGECAKPNQYTIQALGQSWVYTEAIDKLR